MTAGGRVQGKRVAVIGAGRPDSGWSNGAAAAMLYARGGAASVLCVDRDNDAANRTAQAIQAEGGSADIFQADATDRGDVDALAAKIAGDMGGLDILHFNIGISSLGGIAETSFADWSRIFSVNVDAAFHVTQAMTPLFGGAGGAIVYISSIAGQMGGPYSYVGYEASKAALDRLSRAVALELAPRGIRANTVVPGMIDTPHVTQHIADGADLEALRAKRAAQVPLGRQGTAWDVAEAAVFLASDAAGFITGTQLIVDGGMSGRFAAAPSQ